VGEWWLDVSSISSKSTVQSISGVGTTCFHHVVIKIRQLFLRPAAGRRLPNVNPPWNWSGWYISLTRYPRRGSRGVSDIAPRPTFYQNYLAVRNTADVTGGKPIAVYLRCKCYLSYSRLVRHPWKKERGAIFILSRTAHETLSSSYISSILNVDYLSNL
jgi:hypothetical protein